MEELKIKIYTDKYKIAVQQLILNIQRTEFQIDIDLERQIDLCDIPNFYQKNLGNFWIAKFGEKVVGTISLLDIENRETALRKMFVDNKFRGKEYKIGQKLIETVFEYAKMKKIVNIYLGTTEKFLVAQRFYEKNNFIEIDKNNLPTTFPIMSVDVKFYKLKIEN
ncbi:MAG TPA: GNAT family N-acetyltransferase [Flavobacterium sp.]|jgi:N-acetylglutamate synthase-like GNAT family acetyltransferase